MLDKTTILTPEEAAERLRVTPHAIVEELAAGRIKGIRIGDQWRLTEGSLSAFILGEASDFVASPGGQALGLHVSPQAPGAATWQPVSAFEHKWPGGVEVYSPGFTTNVTVGARQQSFTIGFTLRAAAGMDRARAVVFLGTVESSLWPVVEFAGGNNYAENGLMASVVKGPDGKHIRPGDIPPEGYAGLPLGIYRQCVNGPNAARSIAVLAESGELDIMLRHAVLRACMKGWL